MNRLVRAPETKEPSYLPYAFWFRERWGDDHRCQYVSDVVLSRGNASHRDDRRVDPAQPPRPGGTCDKRRPQHVERGKRRNGRKRDALRAQQERNPIVAQQCASRSTGGNDPIEWENHRHGNPTGNHQSPKISSSSHPPGRQKNHDIDALIDKSRPGNDWQAVFESHTEAGTVRNQLAGQPVQGKPGNDHIDDESDPLLGRWSCVVIRRQERGHTAESTRCFRKCYLRCQPTPSADMAVSFPSSRCQRLKKHLVRQSCCLFRLAECL